MQPHQLIIPDEADYRQLLRVVDAAGLQVAADGTVTKKAMKPKRSREELVAIIRRGGDGLSIADPLAWQREQRKERDSVQKARLASFQPTLTEAERQHHLAVIARGGSGKSIPDPVAWQRKTRQDRPLPGRD